MNRRRFLGVGISTGVGAAMGISMPLSGEPRSLTAPSVESPISIDVGRQMFVDDFLIGESSLTRNMHAARLQENNPVLRPETPLEMNNGMCPVACPFEDGVCYDPKDRLFKMWYHAGWFDGVAYAISEDGLRWHRPTLDVEPGTNRVLAAREGYKRDGATVWLDHETTDPQQRFKMFVYFRTKGWEGGQVYTSPDGIHWVQAARTSQCGDNTSFYYDPFRRKWVYSIRSYNQFGRVRSYREHNDFVQGAIWKHEDVVEWLRADALDLPDPELRYPTQLYKFSAVAYESLMLGMFAIFKGPPNEIAAQKGIPKTIDLTVGFSRDGFYWNRPNHAPFLACSRTPGTWNRGYLHSAGGICLIVGDLLYFYFGAFSGRSPKLGGNIYAGASTGLAVLRRDGFASLDAGDRPASMTTRTLIFRGKHLFVNIDAKQGELRVELVDQRNQVIKPFSAENCMPVSGDSTRQAIRWNHGKNLSSLSGTPVRLRFHMVNGSLYSFWVSPDMTGASYGYVAAGGPGFTSSIDTTGALSD
jgi:hypothetical protein